MADKSKLMGKVGVILILLAVGVYAFTQMGGTIPDPRKKNVEVNVEVIPGPGIPPIGLHSVGDVKVTSRPAGLFSLEPTSFSFYCGIPIVQDPYVDLYIELNIPSIQYREYNKIKFCAAKANTRFVVGFPKEIYGTQNAKIKIIRDEYPSGPVEFEKDVTVEVPR